jgi:glycosyltransferase involved in cell wall biosynthesis
MRRLRVLFLIDKISDSGGAERFTLGLATHLPPDRFELWVCSTRSAEPAAVRILEAAGVHHLSLGRRGKCDIHRLGGIVRLHHRHRFDVLHSHMFGSNVWGTLIGTACRIPVIIAEEHTWSYEGEPLRRWLDGRVIGRLATRFVAVSDRDAERMVTVEHVPPEKVLMIPSAYVPRPASDTDVRTELGLEPDTPLLAAVAVLRPQKALSVLLDAIPSVLQAHPRAHLVIAGDGPCRDDLQSQTRLLGVVEQVHFLGLRTDVESILRSADVAIISSDYEGTPLVAYECFANGTPLVATAVGGLPAMIDDGVTGRLVPPQSPEALAGALNDLLADPEMRRRLADAAARSSVNVHIDEVAQRFSTLYEQLARGKIAA